MAGKGSRKHGRMGRSPSKKAYEALHRLETNKAKKGVIHKQKHPNDKQENTKVDYKIPYKVDPKVAAEAERGSKWRKYLKGTL